VLQRQLISLILINSFSFSENIASTGVSVAELEQINGTGKMVELLKMIF
jgi:hypothetical protein